LDKNSFDKLLAWLGADRKAAAARYEECRRALIDFFRNKGCKHSDECADVTFDRVVEIILGGRMGERKDPESYLIRVAHFVRLEYLRHPASFIANPGELWDSRPDNEAQESENNRLDQRRQECMESCLQNLPLESRQLVTRYYEIRTAPERANTKVKMLEALAQSYQKTANALRIEVHRMRTEKLKPCLENCVKNFAEKV
jgi:DNA-directed RNA polymerase specialized sigma24 family protein